MSETIERRVAAFRAVRRELETAVLPLATSVDGRRFTLQAPLGMLGLTPGAYVHLDLGEEQRLGQLDAVELGRLEGTEVDVPRSEDAPDGGRTPVSIRYLHGLGMVLDGDGSPFHDAAVRAAEPPETAAWLQAVARPRAQLQTGELLHAPGVVHALDAGGFGRHTFLCGQSGSGKTYALGVVLERLLAGTDLRIVVLDPNSDFVRLGEVRDGVGPEDAARHRDAAAGVQVRRADGGEDRLRLRFGELEPEAQAALLRLDPIADRDEYAEMAALLAEAGGGSLEAALSAAARSDRGDLVARVRNLGIDRLDVWAGSQPGSVLEDLATARCLVVDLGSLATRTEQALVAQAVLAALWARRRERSPVLIVIDEAHNVCPGAPEDPLTALATDLAVRIAGEGRKFGMYMLVATQRPQKVHGNVVSQCDNLVLMRLNSAADASFAGSIFSFVAPGLLRRATGFGLGEALVAGAISSHPALLRFGARVSQEGGADVPATWAAGPGAARS